jgi:hypothetical protein
MMIHHIKCTPLPFTQLTRGEKTFEARKDDRDPKYLVGDFLIIHEWIDDQYTGRSVVRRVTSILRGPLYGIKKGYCVMSITDRVRISPALAELLSKAKR